MFNISSKIVIIGAGKIAYSLANSLLKANYKIELIISRSKNSAKSLANKFNISCYSNDIFDIKRTSNVFLITVSDSEIKNVSKQISELDLDFPNLLFVHFSGSHNSSIFKELISKNSQVASFHIMQSFPTKDIVELESLNVAIETNSIFAEEFLFLLADKVNLKPFKLSADDKNKYHLSGVFSSNFLVSNLFNVKQLLKSEKSNFPDLSSLISPIISSTLKNVKEKGVCDALSGPISRGELEIIKKHIKELKISSNENEDFFSVNTILLSYISQSLSLLVMLFSQNKKLTKEQSNIKDLLIQELKSFKLGV